jgi:3-methyl-2-oxobutanoate hydroxymethyltransferase
MAAERVTIQQIQRMKREGQRIVMLTAYDYELARIMDRAGPEMLLVGDSGARYALGYAQNIAVTMDEMVLLTRSVCRAAPRALVVADMPFMSYQASVEEAVHNAGRLIKEAGADAVKVEGGEEVAPAVRAMVRAGIPVQGHIGLTPHTSVGVGSYTNPELSVAEAQVRRDAFALQAAGVFSFVFTRIMPPLAGPLSRELQVPTVAGPEAANACDGFVAVIHNIFGLTAETLDGRKSLYGPLARSIHDTAVAFIAEVRANTTPHAELS